MKKDGKDNLSAELKDNEKLGDTRIEEEKLETVTGGGKTDIKALLETAVKVLTK